MQAAMKKQGDALAHWKLVLCNYERYSLTGSLVYSQKIINLSIINFKVIEDLSDINFRILKD
jgi:hypothetical protein